MTAQWTRGKLHDLLEASEWYLEAQGHRLNQEYQDALKDPRESQGRERVGSLLNAKMCQCQCEHVM